MPERGHVHSFGAAGGKTFIDGRTPAEKRGIVTIRAITISIRGYSMAKSCYGDLHQILKKNVKTLDKELGVKF